MKTRIIFNVKNVVIKTCAISSGDKVSESVNFVEYLKGLEFSDLVTEIKKKGCCKKDFLKLSFNEEMKLKKAVKNNSGNIEFSPRRGYTTVILTI